MRTVWKFSLGLHQLADIIWHDVPRGARVLVAVNQPQRTVLGDEESLAVYAEVDPAAPKVPRAFRVAGTGHDIGAHFDNRQYVGTVLFADGSLVFHVFDLGEVVR